MMVHKEIPFQRPILPLLAAYALGVWLCHTTAPWTSNMFVWAILFATSAIAAIFSGNSAVRSAKRSTFFLLMMVVGLGGIRMAEIEQERISAIALLEHMENANDMAPYVIEGTIRQVNKSHGRESGVLILSQVRATNRQTSWHFPGYVQMTWSAARGEQPGTVFLPGDRIRVGGRLVSIRGFLNDDRNLGETRAHKRIYAAVEKKEPIRVMVHHTTLARILAETQESIKNVLLEKIPGNAGNIAASMLLNDRSLLDPEKRDAFSASGLFHLFAVSGLHVMLLAVIFTAFLRALHIPPRFSCIIAVMMLLFYACMLQFNPPVTRAAIMFAMLSLGDITNRATDNLSRFFAAILLILLFDPLALWQGGLHLSVLCVGSILLLQPTIQNWFEPINDYDENQPPLSRMQRMKQHLLPNCALVLAIFLFLMPAQLLYFQQCNLLSPVANLIGVPLASIALPGALLTLVLTPVSDWFATQTGATTAVLFMLLEEWARLLGSASPFILTVNAIPGWIGVLIYGALFSGYFMRGKSSPEFRVKSLAHFVIVFGSVLCVIIALGLLYKAASGQNSQMRMWFLDVGQGDATLIETPDKHYVLIDCGPGAPDAAKLAILPKLKDLNVRTLDCFIATHTDADHVGSLKTLADSVSIDSVLCSQAEKSRTFAATGQETVKFLPADLQEITFGDGPVFDILNNTTHTLTAGADRNTNSVVVQVRWKTFSALVMGDADLEAETRILRQSGTRLRAPTAMMKVGHHGSHSSTGEAFLQRVRPQNAVISCGVRNRFNHPSQSVLQSLAQHQTSVCRTDQDGAIEVKTDGDTYTVSKNHIP